MNEHLPEPPRFDSAWTRAASSKIVRGVSRALSVLLSVAASAWLFRLLVVRDPVQGTWALQVMLAVAAFMAACWGAVHRYRTWTVPIRRLEEMLPLVHQGALPIDRLGDIDGGAGAIVPAVQELLRQIRTQQAVITELEAEMRQRVANRTDALERTIGSLRLQATRDSLTRLFNRRFLDQFLGQSIQRHVKGRKDLCLLMMDVDHFKVLNDTLGHAAGDDLLKAIGQLIRSAIRGEDVGFRCGGDEFVVLLPNSSTDAGRVLADRLISLVDALGKTLRVPRLPRLSVGMATLRETGPTTAEGLLKAADQALYDVKRARKALREGLNGGDREVQSPPPSRKAG